MLFYLLLVSAVNAQAGFGRSYLGNSRLCHQWNCINEKLNLTDSLPLQENYVNTINKLLPEEWRGLSEKAVELCYGNRTKKYSNTCPGQALMHCVVDYLVENCPIEKRSKTDSCAQVLSIAANTYMFSQSRYNDLEKNIASAGRASWLLRNYFNKPCCELPDILKELNLGECGFKQLMYYHIYNTQTDQPFRYSFPRKLETSTSTEKPSLKIVSLQDLPPTGNFDDDFEEEWDPLECCSLNGFIEDSWRNGCHFEMSWNVTDRLGIIDVSSHIPTTTTTEPVVIQRNDVQMMPLSCEKETCVFKKLNIIANNGEIDTIAFTKLLDNMTSIYPEWEKAKARVLTECFRKIHRLYDADCKINEVLRCVFDVLSENCPSENKDDPCKQKDAKNKDIICQISSAKYAPRLRRKFCNIPELVPAEILSQCDMTSLSTLKYVPRYEKTVFKKRWENKVECIELTPPTTCLLNKMGVLNRYGFIDYFKMKNLLHKVSKTPLYELYFTVFLTTPLYHEYCSSPKKLLNILDFMVMTCPTSKRTRNPKCDKIFHEIETTIPPNMTRAQLQDIFKNLQNTFERESTSPKTITRKLPFIKNSASFSGKNENEKFVKPNSNANKIHDFGILDSENAPPVEIIDLKPRSKTLVILPVYQRMNKTYPIKSLFKHDRDVYRQNGI